MSGLIDKPIGNKNEDKFGVKNYVGALSKFIEGCDTPMTIAVQGDWGSGKTSIMNMVKDDLGNKVHSIWFNTWQFSKFNMDDQLSLSLLLALADQLEELTPDHKKKELKDFVSAFAWKILSYSADAVGASQIAEDASNMSGKAATLEYAAPFSGILKLKDHFQKTIDEVARDGKKIVIFIDDLDRLEPSRALDVLEVLKLFLDCEKCVYVLAIDYGVVTRGVKEKYGDDLQGKQFFDKIIQLPFYMPVAHYDIETYVQTALGTGLDKETIKRYVDLIRSSVGCNPRTMKRLFNAFELISMIYGNKGNNKERILLFALLCLQLTYEEAYNHLIENIDMISTAEYNHFLDEDTEKIDSALDLTEEEDGKKEEIQSFMKKLLDIMQDGKEQIVDEDVKIFKDVLHQSATTNNTAVVSKEGKPVLTENRSGEKTLTGTDVKYKICCLGTKFQLGYGQEITVVFEGKEYPAKMHRTSSGRIDGLSKFYNDNDFKEGDSLKVEYKHDDRKVILTKL